MTPSARAHRWAAILLAVYAALVVVVSVVPRPIDRGLTPWFRGVLATLHRYGFPGRIDYEFVELASHVALFLPIGVLAVVALGRRLAWLAVLIGLGISALVEFGQSMLMSDHPLSRLDLLLNVVGTVVGAAIGYWALAPHAGADRAPNR